MSVMGYYGTEQMYMTTDTVDEAATATEMQGPSSSINQYAGRATFFSSPTKTLVTLWFVALGAYWFMGWFFRGTRA
jgi:hypothetical protein